MVLQMARSAQPDYCCRLAVILVVHLRGRCSALRARVALDLPALEINLGVCAGNCPLPGCRRQFAVLRSGGSHVCRVARAAVRLRRSIGTLPGMCGAAARASARVRVSHVILLTGWLVRGRAELAALRGPAIVAHCWTDIQGYHAVCMSSISRANAAIRQSCPTAIHGRPWAGSGYSASSGAAGAEEGRVTCAGRGTWTGRSCCAGIRVRSRRPTPCRGLS
jgi:hypothetical protein